jgi:hypothetical protein
VANLEVCDVLIVLDVSGQYCSASSAYKRPLPALQVRVVPAAVCCCTPLLLLPLLLLLTR